MQKESSGLSKWSANIFASFKDKGTFPFSFLLYADAVFNPNSIARSPCVSPLAFLNAFRYPLSNISPPYFPNRKAVAYILNFPVRKVKSFLKKNSYLESLFISLQEIAILHIKEAL